MRRLGSVWPWIGAVLGWVLGGCAHAPLNRPLEAHGSLVDYRPRPRQTDQRRDDLLLMVFFSGGGTRAAAFSYGVLEELQATTVSVRGDPRPLAGQIDAISAVSGGAFTAAYFCLRGEDTFATFESRVLKRDLQAGLLRACLRPDNLMRLGSPYYARSDVATRYYDRTIFDGATFGDLAQRIGSPFLIINATDLSTGARFGFTQLSFDFIGSDISTFPIARAVAASTAVPLLLTPVTLRNYAHGPVDTGVDEASLDAMLSDRFKRLVADLSSYGNPGERRYIHLVDGGVADNLGLRALQEVTMLNGGLASMLAHLELKRVNKIAIVVVDAATRQDHGWDRSEAVPGTLGVLRGISASLLSKGNYETTELFRQSVQLWQHEIASAGGDDGVGPAIQFYQINVNFAAVADQEERSFLYNLPTGFSLPAETVDRLRTAARRVLRENPTFQNLLRELASP